MTAANQPTLAFLPTSKTEAPALDTRGRLHRDGPQALSTTELLAVVLSFGKTGGDENYLKDSSTILSEPGGLRELRNSSVPELAALRGVGEAKACAISAAIELGARIATSKLPGRPVISSPNDADVLVRHRMAHLDREVFVVILLDTKNHVIATPTIAIGSVDSATFQAREVFKPAIKASARNVILLHNHPSGQSRPSPNDVAITKKLQRLGDDLGIEVLDHVIVGEDFTSLKESGFM